MKRFSPWLTALLQSVILLTVVARASPWSSAEETNLPTPRHAGDITLRGFTPRPIYNGSVVPGGVYSAAELRAAIAGDAVVAAHYRDARLDEMQVVTLTTGRAAYVSYRTGDRIHWTRERIWLKAGETVLTDGITTIRARCGNCVSDVKQERASVAEPSVNELHELDEFVVPATAERGVDPTAGIAEAQLMKLMEVPFAPRTLSELGSSFEIPPVIVGGGTVVGDGDARTWGVVTMDPVPIFLPITEVPTGTTTGTTSSTTTVGVDTSRDTLGEPATGSSSGATPAPEPATLWLVAAGVIGVASRRLRQG